MIIILAKTVRLIMDVVLLGPQKVHTALAEGLPVYVAKSMTLCQSWPLTVIRYYPAVVDARPVIEEGMMSCLTVERDPYSYLQFIYKTHHGWISSQTVDR